MTKNPITREQAQAIDLRKYKHLTSYFGKWSKDLEVVSHYKREIRFNKRSIVWDRYWRFDFKTIDLDGDGSYSVWVYLDGHLICNYLETEFAETISEVEDLVISVLYFIRTRI